MRNAQKVFVFFFHTYLVASDEAVVLVEEETLSSAMSSLFIPRSFSM